MTDFMDTTPMEALPKCATCGVVDKDEWDRHDKESEFYSHDFIAEEAERLEPTGGE